MWKVREWDVELEGESRERERCGMYRKGMWKVLEMDVEGRG